MVISTESVQQPKKYSQEAKHTVWDVGSVERTTPFSPRTVPSFGLAASPPRVHHLNTVRSIFLAISNLDVHGGSVTMASKSSPHRHGLCVTSNVHKSMILDATPYCAAARITPGGRPDISLKFSSDLGDKVTYPFLSSACRLYQNQIRLHRSVQLAVQ